MTKYSYTARSAVLSLTVLGGFSQGIFAYTFASAMLSSGTTHAADWLIAAGMQSFLLTALFAIFILPVSFVVVWLAGNPVAEVATKSARRWLFCADGIGIAVGVLACLAGLRLPTI